MIAAQMMAKLRLTPAAVLSLRHLQAHQRRGESDLVAHWVYVLLALDPQAPEWGHMLAG
jgi:hypothetical protein